MRPGGERRAAAFIQAQLLVALAALDFKRREDGERAGENRFGHLRGLAIFNHHGAPHRPLARFHDHGVCAERKRFNGQRRVAAEHAIHQDARARRIGFDLQRTGRLHPPIDAFNEPLARRHIELFHPRHVAIPEFHCVPSGRQPGGDRRLADQIAVDEHLRTGGARFEHDLPGCDRRAQLRQVGVAGRRQRRDHSQCRNTRQPRHD